MIKHAKDYDDTTRRPLEWWDSLGDVGPTPYATKTWTYIQVLVEAEEDDDD